MLDLPAFIDRFQVSRVINMFVWLIFLENVLINSVYDNILATKNTEYDCNSVKAVKLAEFG